MLLRSVTTTPPPTNHKHFVSRLKLNVFRGHVLIATNLAGSVSDEQGRWTRKGVKG